jgi:hypothetical protein
MLAGMAELTLTMLLQSHFQAVPFGLDYNLFTPAVTVSSNVALSVPTKTPFDEQN